jgi:hypothetical protein
MWSMQAFASCGARTASGTNVLARVAFTSSSVTVVPKESQLFQPIGGVGASGACERAGAERTVSRAIPAMNAIGRRISIPMAGLQFLKSRGAKSYRSRRQVCHSCAVPGDSQ